MTRHYKKWTIEEESTLIQCVKDSSSTKMGIDKATLKLGRNRKAVENKYYKLLVRGTQCKSIISDEDLKVLKDKVHARRNNLDNILIECVKDNPDNLSEVFRKVSNRTDYSFSYVKGRWYEKLSNPESPEYVGTCFLTLSNKRYNNNRKNPSNIIDTNIKTHGEKSAFKAIWTRLKNFLKLS